MGGGDALAPLPVTASDAERAAHYGLVKERLRLLLAGESDWVAAQATIVAELHAAFEYYHWTGFYRHVLTRELIIGPYQGGHGCLRITFDRGVCGACARTKQTQLVPDVHSFPGHIACSGTTLSEVVVPVLGDEGQLMAVFDVDSNHPAAFTQTDADELESLFRDLVSRQVYLSGTDNVGSTVE